MGDDHRQTQAGQGQDGGARAGPVAEFWNSAGPRWFIVPVVKLTR